MDIDALQVDILHGDSCPTGLFSHLISTFQAVVRFVILPYQGKIQPPAMRIFGIHAVIL